MLRNRRDWQAVLYMVLQPILGVWLWCNGFSWVVLSVMLFLSVGISSIHHNHAHLKMWRVRWLNRVTDFWLTLLQGHPTFVFHAAHNCNHHRYRHGVMDVARTYRFGGDTNHLAGYLIHPAQACWVLFPVFVHWLRRLHRYHRGAFWYCLLQYFAVGGLWSVLAVCDWQKFLVVVLVPQLFGLHWLLASNYLQHAHADGRSTINFARNFEGLINPLLFNAGFHTAHHLHGRAHWSELPALHAQYADQVDPRLNEKGLLPYIAKTYLLSLFFRRFRSHSLMNVITDGDRQRVVFNS